MIPHVCKTQVGREEKHLLQLIATQNFHYQCVIYVGM